MLGSAPVLGGAAGLPPPWLTGGMEAPAGEETVGSATYARFTEEQQARLNCDKYGNAARRLIGGGGGLPPKWISGGGEAPAGEETIGSATYGIFTDEQQARLSCDKYGKAKAHRIVGGKAGLPPAWLTGGSEAPAGEETIDGCTFGVFTAEQQSRLNVDKHGQPASKPRLTYWGGVASRAHYYSYVLGYFGKLDAVEFNNCSVYPGTPEFAAFQPKSMLGTLPVMHDGDATCGQSAGIIRYLDRKFNLSEGRTLKDVAKSEELIELSCDMHSMMGSAHYGANRTVSMDALFAADGKVAKILGAYDPTILASGYFCESVTCGDCAFAAALNLLTRLEPECLAAHPNILAFNAAMQANEGIAKVNAMCPYPYFKRKSDA